MVCILNPHRYRLSVNSSFYVVILSETTSDEPPSDDKLLGPASDFSELSDLLLDDPEVLEYINSTTFLSEAKMAIRNSLDCLYRLSMAIQRPISSDRLERLEKIDLSYMEPFDIEHIRNKYQLSKDNEYLAEHLGKANVKRRQLFKYHEAHHEKVVGRGVQDAFPDTTGEEGDIQHEYPGLGEREVDENDFFSEAPSTMHTRISTVYERDHDGSIVTPVDLDSRSESGMSQHHTQRQRPLPGTSVFLLLRLGLMRERFSALIVTGSLKLTARCL
jgi:hypothetical protein